MQLSANKRGYKMARDIFITSKDCELLFKLINEEKEFGKSRNKGYLKNLEAELKRATIVSPQNIPADSITMNSTVLLRDLDSGQETVYTLVYPGNANLAENKISVLAPIGTAILGYRTGDIIEWKVPAGTVKLKVEKILYQPEAAGNFEL